MTHKHLDEPKLIFFRETPKDLLSHPPLASSLQHLETSYLLIVIGRYPHALLACASAVESTLKAGFCIDQNKKSNPTFKTLLNRAQKEFLVHANFLQDDLDEFRLKRNEIIHYGFSPKDDEISAILLLKTGFTLIEQCYKTFFDFSLKQKGDIYGGLLPDIGRQLEIARKVYLKAKAVSGLNLTYCFIPFAHEIRIGIQHWMLSDWQNEALRLEEESVWDATWEFREKQKEELMNNILFPSWEFSCPICGQSESFICELDDEELDKSSIKLKRGVCINCGLVIPKNCPYLTDELCKDQLNEVKPKILKELGIV